MKSHLISASYRRLRACLFVGLSVPLSATAQSSGGVVTDSVFHRTLIASNGHLIVARLALRAAEARVAASGNRSPAALSGEAEEIPSGMDLTNAGSFRLDIEQELLGSSLRKAQRSAASSDIEITRAALAVAERRLLSSLDRDLMRLTGWSAVARRLAAEDDLFSSAEASLRGRFAAGDARYVDILRLRTERLRVQSERAAAIMEAGAARTAILGLLGTPEVTEDLRSTLDRIGLMDPSMALAPMPPIDSLLNSSGAMQLSQARVARANALRQLSIAEIGRRMTASVGAQRFQNERGGYSVGPALAFSTTLPFTARKANQARVQAADFDLRVAEADQRAQIATLRSAIAVARDRYEAARSRLSVYETALLRGAREERESALASFRSGELSLTELLDFERALARAEVDRIRARIEAAEALGDVYTALDEPEHVTGRAER